MAERGIFQIDKWEQGRERERKGILEKHMKEYNKSIFQTTLATKAFILHTKSHALYTIIFCTSSCTPFACDPQEPKLLTEQKEYTSKQDSKHFPSVVP